MAYTYKKGDRVVVKASRYTHAKKGYLAYKGEYPNMKMKYFKNKKKAIAYVKR